MQFSVVIPNYNGKKLLERNLPYVVKACQKYGGKWEIIVADDASEDNSVTFLKANYPQIKLVRNSKNLRFAQNCNSGVKAASGEFIILLNNDVVPDINFIKPLLDQFQDKTVFAVGCKEKDVVGGKVVYSGRGVTKFQRGLALHKRADNMEGITTSWVSGGSGAFRTKMWKILGGMDPLYRPAYEEDRDLSYIALKHGWKVMFEPKSLVFHHHEMTNRQVFSQKQIQAISFKSQFLFVWKNITDNRYLFTHLFWLPYHLIITNQRSNGSLAEGFYLALKQLPEVYRKRKLTKPLFILKDRQLI